MNPHLPITQSASDPVAAQRRHHSSSSRPSAGRASSNRLLPSSQCPPRGGSHCGHLSGFISSDLSHLITADETWTFSPYLIFKTPPSPAFLASWLPAFGLVSCRSLLTFHPHLFPPEPLLPWEASGHPGEPMSSSRSGLPVPETPTVTSPARTPPELVHMG